MGFRILNPVGRPQSEASLRPHRIEELKGARLGLLFNGHVSSVKLWERLESFLTELYHPRSVISLRKENTFAPAAAEHEIAKLKAETDLVIAGVGA